jgi:prenylcysteine oxidase/farnesylcysteine lyase
MRVMQVCWLVSLVVTLVLGQKVAIIGAGIGGASTAYYTKQKLPNATIVCFDSRSYIGGRLHHLSFAGETVELGGAAWTGANEYMKELASAMHVPVKAPAPTGVGAPIKGALDIWQGDGFVDLVKLSEKNVGGVATLAAVEDEFLTNIQSNYANRPDPFSSLPEFLQFGKMQQYTNVSTFEFFETRGVSAELVSGAMEPLDRSIYNQGATSQAFSLLASLTAQLGHYHVSGGNSILVKALLHNASADVRLNSQVTTIRGGTASAGGPRAGFSVKLKGGTEEHFDSVVIASPIECTNITVQDIGA